MKQKLPSVLITHIYNEAYLLKWWMPHHVHMFDKGVVIDYDSTDDSIDIIKKFAPHWKIIKSTEKEFGAGTCDKQVMQQEENFVDHWKLVLNTTEFLCVPNMDSWLWMLEQNDWPAYGIRTAIMIDPPDTYPMAPDPEQPLVTQRHHGFFETEHLISLQAFFSRCRIIHRMRNGAYAINGRHVSWYKTFIHPPGALLKWHFYSPVTKEFIARKLQIGDKVAQEDYQSNPNIHHKLDSDKHLLRYSQEVKKCRDLREVKEYAEIICPWHKFTSNYRSIIERYPATPGVNFLVSDLPRKTLKEFIQKGSGIDYEKLNINSNKPRNLKRAWLSVLQNNLPNYFLIGLEHWILTNLTQNPDDFEMLHFYAVFATHLDVAYLDKEQNKQRLLLAEQGLEKIVFSQPSDPVLWWNLAYIGRYKQDIKAANRAREVAKSLTSAFDNAKDDTFCLPFKL